MKLLSMHLQSKHLNKNEADIMTGAMTLTDKTVKQVMTPRSQMFSIKISCLLHLHLCARRALGQFPCETPSACVAVHASARLDYDLMCAVFKAGYSRVPVFHDTEDRVVGLLFLKDLVLVTPSVRTCPAVLRRAHRCEPS